MVNLKEKPFCLSDEALNWVEETIASMSVDEKVGQLFVQMRKSLDEAVIKDTLNKYHQGGLRWQGGDRNQVYNQNKVYQENSKIPLLIAANCDNGGDGCLSEGTYVATAAEAAAGPGVKRRTISVMWRAARLRAWASTGCSIRVRIFI